MWKNKTLIMLLISMILGTSAVYAEASPRNYIFKLDLQNITNLNIGFCEDSTSLPTADFLMENSAGEYVWQSVNSISINELNESKEAVKEFYLFFGMDTKKSITVKLFANPLRTSNRNAEITYTLSFTEYHSKNSKDHEPFITSKDVNVLPLALSVDRDESQVTIIEKHKGNDDTQSILQGYYKVKLVTENLSVKPRVAYSGNIALRFEIND